MHRHNPAHVRTLLAGFILLVLAQIGSGLTSPTALATLGFVGRSEMSSVHPTSGRLTLQAQQAATGRSVFLPIVLTSGSPTTSGWPTAQGQQAVTSTITISGTYDGGMKRFYGSGDLGDGGQSENQDPLFSLADGAMLKNVILGSPAADGIHCEGSCTLLNVWWEDVGEDAATFRGSSSLATYLVDGGARHAADKVFQHNGAGTLTIRNFLVEDFGKLYRSCGNCSTQYQRGVAIENVTATAPGKVLAGINTNYGDTARFAKIAIVGDSSRQIAICERYTGNNTGAEPVTTGSGADGTYCLDAASNISYH